MSGGGETMQIEPLEGRVLLSASPCAAPADVTNSALGMIDAAPAQVLKTAGNALTGPQSTPDPAALDFVEYHQGLSLYVYPDATGHPTLGSGLNLDSTGGATGADTLLAGIGLSYSDILASWTATRQLWVHQGHALSQLKTGTAGQLKAWLKFIAQNPAVTTPVITDDQATQLLNNAALAYSDQLVTTIGPEFYRLDLGPQTALIDLAFSTGGVSRLPRLIAAIQGNASNATDYAKAATDMPLTAPVNSAIWHRQSDDRALMRQGEFPTTLTLQPPSPTMSAGESQQLILTIQNSQSKNILLASNKFSYASASPSNVMVTSTGRVVAGAGGTTEVLFSLVDDPAINTAATITVNDGTSVTVPITEATAETITPPNVIAGETIEVTAALTTANLNENASGESLAITSADGFATSLVTFNQPLGFTLIAGVDGQSLTAQFDGTESGDQAIITARVVPQPSVTFSSTVRTAMSEAGSDLNALALTATTAATTGEPSSTLIATSNVLAAQAGLLADELNVIAAGDSPDLNFKSIAQPTPPRAVQPVRPSQTMSAYLAAALTATDANTARLIAMLATAQTTADRADAAISAGNTVAAARQQVALTRLEHTTATLVNRQAAALARVSVAVQRVGLDTAFDDSELLNSEQNILTNGLPFGIVQSMESVGGNAVAVNAARNASFAENISQVDGSITDALNAPALTADLAALARSLD
jgi:hypothetical protein